MCTLKISVSLGISVSFSLSCLQNFIDPKSKFSEVYNHMLREYKKNKPLKHLVKINH